MVTALLGFYLDVLRRGSMVIDRTLVARVIHTLVTGALLSVPLKPGKLFPTLQEYLINMIKWVKLCTYSVLDSLFSSAKLNSWVPKQMCSH